MSSKTFTVQIGNSDDKLTQKEWSNFVRDLERDFGKLMSEVHFSGSSPSNAMWQNFCMVAVVDEVYIRAGLGWESFREYIDYAIKPTLAVLCQRYKQDSIALTIGETVFIEERDRDPHARR